MATRERHQITSYPTPLPVDLIFFEIRDSTLPKNKIWAYGDAHPNVEKWPNHILVYVAEETNKYAEGDQKWYYAADRENQDLYNWESTIANLGEDKFDAVKRTYVFLRDDYDPEELQMGAVMPNVPANRFPDTVTADGNNTTNNDNPPSYTNHVLAYRSQLNSSDQVLNSMFVVEQRTYIKRCSITMIQTEDFFGIGGSRIDNLYYRGEVVDGFAVEVHFNDPNSDYWGWQADGRQRDGQQLSENWFVISIISSILDVIDDYVFSYPTLITLNLPRKLVNSQLTFNVNKGEGNQDQDGWASTYGGLPLSVSLGLTDSCSSSVSITPELGLTFEDPDGSYIPAMVYAFFLPQPATMEDIISRVSALHGSTVSIYEPPTTSTAIITLVGATASVKSTATAAIAKKVESNGGSDSQEKTVSTEKSVGQSTQFLQVSGFTGGLNVNDSATDSVSATASISISGSGFAEAANVSAFITDSATATSSVTTSGGGGSINLDSGSYITKIEVEHYRFQRAKIFIVVVDSIDYINR